MAKPARAKKKQAAAPVKKGEKKAEKIVSQSKVREEKGKEAKGGLKSRLSKPQPAKPAKGAPAKEKRSVARFLREVRSELSKVTWPSREELFQSTLVVVVAVIIAGVYIAVLDQVFTKIIGLLS